MTSDQVVETDGQWLTVTVLDDQVRVKDRGVRVTLQTQRKRSPMGVEIYFVDWILLVLVLVIL